MTHYFFKNEIIKDFLDIDIKNVNEFIYSKRFEIKNLFGIEIIEKPKKAIYFSNDISTEKLEDFNEFLNNSEAEITEINYMLEVKNFLFSLDTDTSQRIFINDLLKCSYSTIDDIEYYLSEYYEEKLNNIQREVLLFFFGRIRFTILVIIRDYRIIFKDIFDDFLLNNKKYNLYQLNDRLGNHNTLNSPKARLLWHKVGVKFADGSIYELLDKKNSYNQISMILFESKNLRPYISDSLSTNLNSDKNIFKDLKKIENILAYCEENEIPIHPRFIEKYELSKNSLN